MLLSKSAIYDVFQGTRVAEEGTNKLFAPQVLQMALSGSQVRVDCTRCASSSVTYVYYRIARLSDPLDSTERREAHLSRKHSFWPFEVAAAHFNCEIPRFQLCILFSI